MKLNPFTITKRQMALRSVGAFCLLIVLVVLTFAKRRDEMERLQGLQSYIQQLMAQGTTLQRIGVRLGRLESSPGESDRKRLITALRDDVVKIRATDDRLRDLTGPAASTFAASDVFRHASEELMTKLESYVVDLSDIVDKIDSGTAYDPSTLRWLAHDAVSELSAMVDSVWAATNALGAETFSEQKWNLWVYTGLLLATLLGLGIFLLWPMLDTFLKHQEEQADAARQIHERNQRLSLSEERLTSQKRILESVLENLADGVVVVFVDGSLVLQNPSANRLLNRIDAWRDFSDWYARVGIHDPDTGVLIPAERSMLSLLLKGEPQPTRLVLIRNDLHPEGVYVTVTGRTMYDDRGAVKGALLSFHDMTERIEYERELQRAKQEAESASKLKSEFLANISHEIRTPMTSILGYSDTLLDASQPPERRRRNVQILRRNGKMLMKLIDDILDISKIESGRLELERETIAVSTIVSEVQSLLIGRAEEKCLALEVRTEGEVPAHIQTDPIRLRQILINIVGNAIKFTERGRVSLSVSYRRESNRIEFGVSDTGCGIPPDSMERLFQPFVQVDNSPTRRFGGTGLGLALSQRLATALGGDLSLDWSRVGEGTRFRLGFDAGDVKAERFLTRLNLSDPTLEAMGKTPAEVVPTSGLENVTILLVEDSPENSELFRYFLETAGASVVTASDGIECLSKAQECQFSVVLMDLQMPGMDGYQALSVLRERQYASPILALTAHAMNEDRERCRQAGFDGYLVKPIDPQSLFEAVLRVVKPQPEAAPRREVHVDRRRMEGASPRVREIIQKFVDVLSDRMNEAESAWKSGDWDGLARLLHRFKGTAGNCGFPELMEEAGRLEDETRHTRREDSVAKHFQKLGMLIELARGEWTAFLTPPSAAEGNDSKGLI